MILFSLFKANSMLCKIPYNVFHVNNWHLVLMDVKNVTKSIVMFALIILED